MKKILIVLMVLVVLLGVSCEFRDRDGFRLFEFGWSVAPDHALIQSHDGFEVDGTVQYEIYHEIPITIMNVADDSISVRITTTEGQEWVVIPTASSYTVSP